MKLHASTAKKLRTFLEEIAEEGGARAEKAAGFADELVQRRHRRNVLSFVSRIALKTEKRLSRKEHRAEVRAACVARANGHCECGCGTAFGIGEYTPEWDEFYGRRHVTVEETWMLIRMHHRMKTENDPSRAAWDLNFRGHCARHGYQFRARLVHHSVGGGR